MAGYVAKLDLTDMTLDLFALTGHLDGDRFTHQLLPLAASPALLWQVELGPEESRRCLDEPVCWFRT